jgi:hypothetical protein
MSARQRRMTGSDNLPPVGDLLAMSKRYAAETFNNDSQHHVWNLLTWR